MELLDKNNLPLLIIVSLICNTIFTFFMMKFYHELNNDRRKQNFYNLIKKSEEYENKTIDKDFIKFIANNSQVPMNDKEIEDLYFKIHSDEKIGLKRDPRIRKYVYILVILWLVNNVLLAISLLNDKKIERKFKYIFFGVQIIFIYLLAQVYTYVYGKNKDFSLNDDRKNSVGYLIIFVWLAFILLLFKFLGVLDKNFSKSISKEINNILNNNTDKEQERKQQQKQQQKEQQQKEQQQKEQQQKEQQQKENNNNKNKKENNNKNKKENNNKKNKKENNNKKNKKEKNNKKNKKENNNKKNKKENNNKKNKNKKLEIYQI